VSQLLKSTSVAPSSPLQWQLYRGSELHGSGTQSRSGSKSIRFSNFSFVLAFRKCFSFFGSLSSRFGFHTWLEVHKVDYCSRIQSPHRTATKADFGFQVTSQSPLRTQQSRLQFSSRISKSDPHSTKSTSVFKSHLKVRSAQHKVDFGFQVAF
jgi:hypothetical protein